MFPRVIVMDRDLACMNACNNVFPEAKGLLCRWHIDTSIKRKYKTFLVHRRCWTSFYKGWKKLVESETEEAYNSNLLQVENILVDYKGKFNISFRFKTWLTQYKEKLVSVWTDVFLHFGNYTTNRVESHHAKVKLYLDSSQSDLVTVLPRIHDVVQSQHYAIKASLGQSMIIARHRFVHLIFRYLVGNVSIYALEIIFKEFEQIKFLEICGY
uniref:MULE transposase domain-containing protein n=1 Tax=Lactuca sativa TaxID=4236 RepID=A0A9R1VM15_LACSA|nr:hypothetical protein LSAT_V11C500242010 [Lactuca sativa]